MVKKIFLLVIWSMMFSCKPPESTSNDPCYTCQISETFKGVTTISYWDRCGAAGMINFKRDNTYKRLIIQGNVGDTLSRVTTCVSR